MNPELRAQDDPFDHEAVSRHNRGDSTAHLLGHSAGPSVSDLSNNGDSFYDNAGPSKTDLYDPEKHDSDSKPADYTPRNSNYEDLGTFP